MSQGSHFRPRGGKIAFVGKERRRSEARKRHAQKFIAQSRQIRREKLEYVNGQLANISPPLYAALFALSRDGRRASKELRAMKNTLREYLMGEEINERKAAQIYELIKWGKLHLHVQALERKEQQLMREKKQKGK